jgi:hypothetical protein
MSTATAQTIKSADYLARKGLKRAKNDRAWDWLRDIADNVRHYMQAPAILLPMLKDEQLTAKVIEQGNTDTLNDLVKRLGGDVQTYVQRFQKLYATHSQRRGSSSDVDDMFRSITISQDYMSFMSSYESVVMPTILEILEILEKAGLNTGSVRAATNSQLVYDLYNEAPTPSTDSE